MRKDHNKIGWQERASGKPGDVTLQPNDVLFGEEPQIDGTKVRWAVLRSLQIRQPVVHRDENSGPKRTSCGSPRRTERESRRARYTRWPPGPAARGVVDRTDRQPC